MQKLLFFYSLFFLVLFGVEAQNGLPIDQQSSELKEITQYNNHVSISGNQGILLPEFTVSKIIEASKNVLIKEEDKVIFKGGSDGYIRVKKGRNTKGVIAQKGAYFRAYIEEPINPSSSILETTEELSISNSNQLTLEAIKIKMYPNPFEDRFILQLELVKTSNVTIELFDPLGRMIQVPFSKKELTKGRTQLEIVGSNLTQGIYLCKIRIGEKEFVQSILKLK